MSELRGLQSRIDEFDAAGVRIVAVSPDSPEENEKVVSRFDLGFPILSDENLEVTRALGLVHEGGGMDGSNIPRPAIFVVEQGQITYRDLTDNWRVRVKADELLEVLRQM